MKQTVYCDKSEFWTCPLLVLSLLCSLVNVFCLRMLQKCPTLVQRSNTERTKHMAA